MATAEKTVEIGTNATIAAGLAVLAVAALASGGLIASLDGVQLGYYLSDGSTAGTIAGGVAGGVLGGGAGFAVGAIGAFLQPGTELYPFIGAGVGVAVGAGAGAL